MYERYKDSSFYKKGNKIQSHSFKKNIANSRQILTRK